MQQGTPLRTQRPLAHEWDRVGVTASGAVRNDPCLVTVPAIDFTGSERATSNRPIEAFAQIYIWIRATSDSGTIDGCFVQQVSADELGQLGRAQPWSDCHLPC